MPVKVLGAVVKKTDGKTRVLSEEQLKKEYGSKSSKK